MKFCQNCGSELKEGASFCANCGAPAKIETNVPQQPVEPQSQTTNNGSRPVVENKNVAVWIILSIVTCGICGIIWFINMVNDVNKVCQDDKSSQSGGVVFLLSLVTCGIYAIIWYYQVGKRMETAGKNYGMQISDNSVIYLVLSLIGLGIVNYCLIQSDLNKFSTEQ